MIALGLSTEMLTHAAASVGLTTTTLRERRYVRISPTHMVGFHLCEMAHSQTCRNRKETGGHRGCEEGGKSLQTGLGSFLRVMVVQLCTSAKKPLNHTLELCPSTACCFLNRSISLDTTLGAATQLGQLPQAFPAPLRATWGGRGCPPGHGGSYLPGGCSFPPLSSPAWIQGARTCLPCSSLCPLLQQQVSFRLFREIPWKSRGSSCWGRVLPGALL